jgi:hypothetical protein
MTVSVTNTTSLTTKLVQDTDAGNVAVDNTTGGAGTLYSVEIDNSANGSAVYFKLANTADATAGTTAADVVLMCPGNNKVNYVFVSGLAFNVGFSHWCVTAAAESSTGAPGSSVIVRYITA